MSAFEALVRKEYAIIRCFFGVPVDETVFVWRSTDDPLPLHRSPETERLVAELYDDDKLSRKRFDKGENKMVTEWRHPDGSWRSWPYLKCKL
jgi:hypothetical protein